MSDGFVRITAEEGYRLYSIRDDRFFSEAVVKEEQVSAFKAVAL